MSDNKEEFYKWMTSRICKTGKTYSKTSVNNCVRALTHTFTKFDIDYSTISNVFSCNTYSEFSILEKTIRDRPEFEFWDGKNHDQRWIHNGLILYSYFLLEKENIAEEDRADYLDSLVIEKAEGKKVLFYTTRYERIKKYRDAAINEHGLVCQCCDFDFYKKYGELGRNFIEVHHIKPLYSLDAEIIPNPKTDFACVCSNCHRMIHRKKDSIVTVEQLRNIILKTESSKR